MDVLIVVSALFYLGLFVGALQYWALPLVREQRKGLDTPS